MKPNCLPDEGMHIRDCEHEDMDLREQISKILIKWSMSTRQAAISDIVSLIQEERRKAKEEGYREGSEHLVPMDAYGRKIMICDNCKHELKLLSEERKEK